jgi:hypothetical protein
MNEMLLQNRDYAIILAKTSASMRKEPPGYEYRWQNAHESIINLINVCQKFDNDGVTLYVSCKESKPSSFQQYKYVNPGQLREIIEAHYPPDELELLGVLKKALDDFFTRKAAGETKANGETIIVLIDGEPHDRIEVAKLIVEATAKLENGEELGIGFLQIGDDLLARGFLKALDDNLMRAGATFDIVDTKIMTEIQEHSLMEFLLHTIND